MTVPNLDLIILLLIFLQSISELKVMGGLRRDNMHFWWTANASIILSRGRLS